MNGRVVEIEYAKGWGRVLLEDGRLLTFDVGACVEGFPHRDAQVVVTLVPARLGGEKVGRITVRDEVWVALPDDLPYVVCIDELLVIRDGIVEQAGVAVDRPSGETGYAVFEARSGVISHTAAWFGAKAGTENRDVRVRTLHASPVRGSELALFRAFVDENINELKESLDDAEGEDETRVRAVGDELVGMVKLANRLRVQRQRRESN